MTFQRTLCMTVAAAVISGGTVAMSTQASAAADPPAGTRTTLGGHGWSTATENPGFGSVSLSPSSDDPYGQNAADLATGPGDSASNKGGKPYLVNSSYGGTLLSDITSLGYATKVLTSPQPNLLNAALNLSLVADDPSSPTGYSFAGTLVYEPYRQGGADTVQDRTWQTWDPMSADAQWWFTRDIVDTNGNVLLNRQDTARLDQIEADFAQNPKYDDIRLYPTGGGLNISLGQAGYDPNTSNVEALVDGVTFGSEGSPVTSYDFEDGIGPCLAQVDDASQTYTLTDDCTTTTQIDVPDGWTVDGAGHTITAVENPGSPNFTGGVLASAVGTAGAAAKLNVENLTIATQFSGSNSGDNLYGIYLHRAGGSITDVVVDGITHGNGVQEGRAIMVDNRTDAGSNDTPRAAVTLDRVSVTDYQKAGVQLEGNLRFTATRLNVGMAGTPDGLPLTKIAANSVEILYGAHGSLTDSAIAENNYADDNTGDAADSDATAVLLFNAGTVDLARNVISGTDGDVGIDIYNDSNTITTNATISCSTITRSDGGHADSTFGFGIWSEDSGVAGSTNVTVASNTYGGWASDVTGDVTTSADSSCITSTALHATPTRVTSPATTKLTGQVSTKSGGSVRAANVTLQAKPVGERHFTTVDSTRTARNGSYRFTAQPGSNTRYRVLVSKDTYMPSTSNTVLVLLAPRITTSRTPPRARPSQVVTFTGSVSPGRARHTVVLQRKQGNRWVGVRNTRLDRTGSYRFTWRTRTTGQYLFRVVEFGDSEFAQGTSRTIGVTVSR